MSKTYVSSWLVSEIENYHQLHGVPEASADVKKCNKHFYKNYPEISKRTLRQATKAVRDNDYRSDLTQPHYIALPKSSIVPDQFSDLDLYHERMQDLIDRCTADSTRIKLANVQDVHLETIQDKAILNLVFQVLDVFQPDYVPVLADLIDNILLKNEMHGASISEVSVESDLDAKTFFEEATYWYLETLRDILDNPILASWLGNHEWWLLRHFLNSEDSPMYFLNHFMGGFKERGGLWLEGDKRLEIPITDNVIGIHGWLARKSRYGSTAEGYLKNYNYDVSIFAGHSHRPETVWSPPNYFHQGRNFVNVTGTLGNLRPEYLKQRYTGHSHSITLAYLAPSGNIGHEIVPVDIHYVNGYYQCYFQGQLFRERCETEPTWIYPIRMTS